MLLRSSTYHAIHRVINFLDLLRDTPRPEVSGLGNFAPNPVLAVFGL